MDTTLTLKCFRQTSLYGREFISCWDSINDFCLSFQKDNFTEMTVGPPMQIKLPLNHQLLGKSAKQFRTECTSTGKLRERLNLIRSNFPLSHVPAQVTHSFQSPEYSSVHPGDIFGDPSYRRLWLWSYRIKGTKIVWDH